MDFVVESLANSLYWHESVFGARKEVFLSFQLATIPSIDKVGRAAMRFAIPLCICLIRLGLSRHNPRGEEQRVKYGYIGIQHTQV